MTRNAAETLTPPMVTHTAGGGEHSEGAVRMRHEFIMKKGGRWGGAGRPFDYYAKPLIFRQCMYIAGLSNKEARFWPAGRRESLR